MEIQTSEVTPEGSTPDVNIIVDGEQPTEPQETEATEETPNEPDYKAKFAASTKEAQRLQQERKDLQAQLEADRARLEALEREKTELEDNFKSENPEQYDAVKTRRELEGLKRDLVQQKEEIALNSFLGDMPEAKGQKEALRKLGRAHPNMAYADLWDTVVKPIMESGAAVYGDKQVQKKTTQPETGKGSKTTDDADLAAYSKLTLAEKKEWLKKHGVKGDISLSF